jgi:hypothetical protein
VGFEGGYLGASLLLDAVRVSRAGPLLPEVVEHLERFLARVPSDHVAVERARALLAAR